MTFVPKGVKHLKINIDMSQNPSTSSHFGSRSYTVDDPTKCIFQRDTKFPDIRYMIYLSQGQTLYKV